MLMVEHELGVVERLCDRVDGHGAGQGDLRGDDGGAARRSGGARCLPRRLSGRRAHPGGRTISSRATAARRSSTASTSASAPGEVATIVGPNGAGQEHAAQGDHRPGRDAGAASVRLDGAGRHRPARRPARAARDRLRAAGQRRVRRPDRAREPGDGRLPARHAGTVAARVEEVLETFPALAEMRTRTRRQAQRRRAQDAGDRPRADARARSVSSSTSRPPTWRPTLARAVLEEQVRALAETGSAVRAGRAAGQRGAGRRRLGISARGRAGERVRSGRGSSSRARTSASCSWGARHKPVESR